MTFALSETRSGETTPRLRPSLFQELNARELKIMLSREIQSLSEENIEPSHSHVGAITGISAITIENDFWKEPLFYVEIETKLDTDNDTRIYEQPEQEASRFRERMYKRSVGFGIRETDQDLIDWDAHIETPPPPRQSGTIKVRFKYVGRSKPIPIDDPWG